MKTNKVNLNKAIISASVAPAVDKVENIVAVVVTKTSIANPLLKDMFAQEKPIARKDMIAILVEKAGLTKPGAATYLQNFKNKNGLTKPRATAVAA